MRLFCVIQSIACGIAFADNQTMAFFRSSGVLLHVTSLPSYGGIGDLGPAAHEFVAFLASARQHVWQVLPLGPTGYGNSPYAATSAFAGNPLLISLELLSNQGWIEGSRIADLNGRGGPVDFHRVEEQKLPLLFEAAGNFLDRGPRDPSLAAQWKQFEEFCRVEEVWLADYALYAVLRREFNTGAWTEWPEPLRRRQPEALAHAATLHRNRPSNLPFLSSGINSARLPRRKESESWAMWPSSSTWIQPTYGFIPKSSTWTRI
jgi:4-alpha-glucanotransferase